MSPPEREAGYRGVSATYPSRPDAERAAMRRALELARLGPAYGPNPRVGCVILDSECRLVGEGYHRGAGTDHAEVMALADAGARARGGSAVVTLEPCNHQGRTGPCSHALVAAGIARVVFGTPDPNLAASGGAAHLAAAGVEVEAGLLDAECMDLIARWALAVRNRRPHVTLKLAASLDGRIAAPDGTSRWITGELAREHAHLLRAEMDAIVIGTGTLLADDPALTARSGGLLAPHQPLRVVIGHTDIPREAAIHRGPGEMHHARSHDLAHVLDDLYDLGARRVLVEGGARLASAFVRSALVDEVHAYLAPVVLGDGLSAIAPFGVETITRAWRLRPVEVTQLGEDVFWRLEKG